MTVDAQTAVQTLVGRTGVETPRVVRLAYVPIGAEFNFCEGDAQVVTHVVSVGDRDLAAAVERLPGFTPVRIVGSVGAPNALGHRPLLAERVELLEVDT